MTRRAEERFSVEIDEAILKWAVETSGLTYGEASKKISDKETLIEDWINKKTNPTFKQIEKLANLVKRPIGSFFLSAPPLEKPKLPDLRMMTGKEGKFERKTILAIRRIRSLQKVIGELSTKEEITSSFPILKLEDKPEIAARAYRDSFGIDENKQIKFKSPYELYHLLRLSLEKMNIYSFQISMPITDARGFAISDEAPYIVVVNSADAIEARIFTLMHEFAHLLIGKTGVDILDLDSNDKVERWCNDFAANFLLPKDIANRVFKEKEKSIDSTETLNYLSRKYKVSKAMLLYDMLKLKYISRNKLEEILARYKPTAEKKVTTKDGKKIGGVPMEITRMAEMGNRFVNLVANNLDKNRITYSDALNYLSIKSKKLDKLLGKAKI